MESLLLLDTASLYFRAFFGIPDNIKSPTGQPINAVKGLLDFIARLATEYQPSQLVCCWDESWRPRWRTDLLPSYKAHRVAADGSEIVPEMLQMQVPIIQEMLAALGICVIGKTDYEADDIIGSLATQSRLPVDIVTGDRDLFQLVSDQQQIRVLYIARGISKHEKITDLSVVEKYGVLPTQYADFATLKGDASDGLPGVAGVGDKTAASLLLAYGDLAGVIAAANDAESALAPGPRAKIHAAAEYLAVAPKVVQVARDLEFGNINLAKPVAAADPKKVSALASQYGLESSVVRISKALNFG